MNKIINTIRGRVKKALSRIRHRGRLAATAGMITFYRLCCLLYWYVEFVLLRGAGFLDVILWNTATLFGQDFADHYPVSVAGRLLGLVLLLIGMFGVSAITGYISSALIEHNMNSMRGMKKLQSLRNHVIICGWKDDLKDLILDIVRKNRRIRFQDIVLVNNMDEARVRLLLDDEELKGLHYVRGDYTEEQILMRANARTASRVLVMGQSQENLEPELMDSRVFAAVLMVRGMNAKAHICAEVKTKKYKNYLEAQKCDEVIYSEEYTRYILSTATSYDGMAKVLSSLFDNGDGVSVQIFELGEEWQNKTFGELFLYYKKQNIMTIGVLENMGAERKLKHALLAEAYKSTGYGEIVHKIKEVRTVERNAPVLNPPDEYVIGRNTGVIVLAEEV